MIDIINPLYDCHWIISVIYVNFLIHFPGNCICDEGYFGSDCSVEIRPGNDGSPSRISLPRTSSLANYGLCNVRAKPCRDIVVLGDGFVDHPSLTCIYETYKVIICACKS